MTAPVRPADDGPRSRVGPVVAAVWLVAVWVALWGGLSWANVGGGVVVALVVLLLFPTGPGTGGRLSPWPALRYVVWFAGQLVVATAQVVVAAVAPSGRVRPGVVAVTLRSRSALVATVVANSVTLTPGTLTVDVERVVADPDAAAADDAPRPAGDAGGSGDDEAVVDGDATRVLLVHALDADDPAAVRASVLAFEERAVAAFGTVTDRAALAGGDPSPTGDDPSATADDPAPAVDDPIDDDGPAAPGDPLDDEPAAPGDRVADDEAGDR